jgi:Flp pilus assembly protein TadG
MALFLPVLLLLVLGSVDFGRALDLRIEMTGASRAGVRTGIKGASNDIGDAVRSEPANAIANTNPVWGDEGPAGPNSCAKTVTICGDPGGCVATDFNVGQSACFAVRTCTHVGASNTYSNCTAWNTRPGSSSNDALEVLVVYRWSPSTPIISSWSKGGWFYLTGDTLAVETY